jgi:hypothetical protein
LYERTTLSDVLIAKTTGRRDVRMLRRYASLRGSDLAGHVWWDLTAMPSRPRRARERQVSSSAIGRKLRKRVAPFSTFTGGELATGEKTSRAMLDWRLAFVRSGDA